MAEDVVEQTIAVPRTEPEPLVRPRPAEPPRVHRWRFAVAYLALAVLAGVGVGLAVMLVTRPDDGAEVPWSQWQPVGRETSYPDQIAQRIGGAYRLPSGRQLAAVTASPPRVTSSEPVAVQAVVIQNRSALPSARPSIEIVSTEDAIMYELCGLGQQCSIAEGEPSMERFQLLRREALELGLYTFKYVEGAESVIVLLPPNLGENVQDPSDDESIALFLQKKDFERELAQPVGSTLSLASPPGIGEQSPNEVAVVNRLTDQHIFQYQFEQAQTGGALMILAPINARR